MIVLVFGRELVEAAAEIFDQVSELVEKSTGHRFDLVLDAVGPVAEFAAETVGAAMPVDARDRGGERLHGVERGQHEGCCDLGWQTAEVEHQVRLPRRGCRVVELDVFAHYSLPARCAASTWRAFTGCASARRASSAAAGAGGEGRADMKMRLAGLLVAWGQLVDVVAVLVDRAAGAVNECDDAVVAWVAVGQRGDRPRPRRDLRVSRVDPGEGLGWADCSPRAVSRQRRNDLSGDLELAPELVV